MIDEDAPVESRTTIVRRRRRRFIDVLALLLLCLGLLTGGLATWYHLHHGAIARHAILGQVEARAARAAADFDRRLADMRRAADTLARDLPADDAGTEAAMATIHAAHGLFGVGVAYLPFAHDPDHRLHAPYLMRTADGTAMRRIEDSYDYSAGSQLWYDRPIRSGTGAWNEPHYGQVSRTMLASYSVPVVRDGKTVAVVLANYSLDNIRDFIGDLDLGQTCYAVLMTSSGRLLYHPRPDLVVADGSPAAHDALLDALGEVVPGTTRRTRHPIDGSEVWVVSRAIADTGWRIHLICMADELDSGGPAERRALAVAIAGFVVAACGVLLLVLRRRSPGAHWAMAMGSTTVLAAGILGLWLLMRLAGVADDGGAHIVDRAGLGSWRTGFADRCLRAHQEPPIFIPTGLRIDTLTFDDAAAPRVSGIVWQKFSGGQDGLPRGVVFADASDQTLKPAYEHSRGGQKTVGWTFTATLRQTFDYRAFPFDRHVLGVRMRSPDVARNLVLVPDLDAYPMLAPRLRPGLAEEVSLPAWSVEGSAFTMSEMDDRVDFGIDAALPRQAVPVLRFEIQLARHLMNPVIINGLPLAVVIFLCFLLLMMVTVDKRRADAFGYKTTAIMNTTCGLFLVIIFQHVNLRRTIGTGGISYLEYVYFLVYVAFIILAVSSYLVARGVGIERPNDNRMAKILFWPVLSGLLFIITVLTAVSL